MGSIAYWAYVTHRCWYNNSNLIELLRSATRNLELKSWPSPLTFIFAWDDFIKEKKGGGEGDLSLQCLQEVPDTLLLALISSGHSCSRRAAVPWPWLNSGARRSTPTVRDWPCDLLIVMVKAIIGELGIGAILTKKALRGSSLLVNFVRQTFVSLYRSIHTQPQL